MGGEKGAGERTYKPDSVPPRMCSPTAVIISLGSELPRTSSDLPEDLGRASRWRTLSNVPLSSYLVLHRATLTVPVMSPSPRWALTPPFHPCLIRCDLIGIHVALAIGGLFSVVPVSDRSAWALPSALPSKSGLSSRAVTSDHPILSLARPQYRKRPHAMQQQEPLSADGQMTNGKLAAVRRPEPVVFFDRSPSLRASIF